MLFGAIGSGLGRGSTNVQASGQFRRATSTCIFFATTSSHDHDHQENSEKLDLARCCLPVMTQMIVV